jgi:hypothetical protein
MSIAQTIYNQLGASRFMAMTGAKGLVNGGKSLTFRIGRNASKANMVRITLAETDTYIVEFFRYRSLDCALINSFEGIYADGLRDLCARTGRVRA